MVFEWIFGGSFEEIYYNPDAVTIAFLLLVFILIFAVLDKVNAFRGNRGISLIVAILISLIFVGNFRFLIAWLNTFNFLFLLAAVGIVFFVAKPFYHFLRWQF